MVAKEFEAKTGQKRITPARTVKRLREVRKKEIENLEIGEDENNS